VLKYLKLKKSRAFVRTNEKRIYKLKSYITLSLLLFYKYKFKHGN